MARVELFGAAERLRAGESELINGWRFLTGTTCISAVPLGAGFAMQVLSSGATGEYHPAKSKTDDCAFSAYNLCIGITGQTEVRYQDRVLKQAAGDVVLVDTDSSFTLEGGLRQSHAVLQIPKAVLGNRLVRLRASAGQLFAGDDARVAVVRDGLLSLMSSSAVLSADEQHSVFAATLHLVDILVAPTSVSATDRLYARATALIARCYEDSDLSPALLARELHVSRRHLEMCFAAKGQTIVGHIWEHRVSRAAESIISDRSAKRNLNEIAQSCGFVSAAHFSRAFARKYGAPPSKYRETLRARA